MEGQAEEGLELLCRVVRDPELASVLFSSNWRCRLPDFVLEFESLSTKEGLAPSDAKTGKTHEEAITPKGAVEARIGSDVGGIHTNDHLALHNRHLPREVNPSSHERCCHLLLRLAQGDLGPQRLLRGFDARIQRLKVIVNGGEAGFLGEGSYSVQS